MRWQFFDVSNCVVRPPKDDVHNSPLGLCESDFEIAIMITILPFISELDRITSIQCQYPLEMAKEVLQNTMANALFLFVRMMMETLMRTTLLLDSV